MASCVHTPAMRIHRIPLNDIEPEPTNPNHHSEEKIATLAANIAEFGLINPISVKPANVVIPFNDPKQTYVIIAGEGRYRAFRKLWSESGSEEQAEQYEFIHCLILTDTSDYKDWGRRLSENLIRSFNWPAECVSLASMRDHGKTAESLAIIFGYKVKYLTNLAALGFIPGIEKLSGCDDLTQNDLSVSLLSAAKYILPLRIWPSDIPKNDKALDYSLYDYSECILAIDKLVSGELSPSDLPTYSAERREVIAEKRQEQTIKAAAQADVMRLKDELATANTKWESAQDSVASEIKKAQEAATKAQEKAKAELQQTIEANKIRLQETIVQLESAGADHAKLDQMIADLQSDNADLEEQLADKKAEIARLRDEIRADIEEQVRTETIELLRKEIQATVDEEAEKELADQVNNVAKEIEAADKEKKRLEGWQERLKKREDALLEKQKRMDEQKQLDSKVYDIQGFIKWFNRAGDGFIEMLGTANQYDYWNLIEKPELKRMVGVLSGVGDELRKIETTFESRGLLGRS